jgi:hypothetical protein
MRLARLRPFLPALCLVACGGNAPGGATPPDASLESGAGETGDASPGAASADADASGQNQGCIEADASEGATALPLGSYTQCIASIVSSDEAVSGNDTGTLTLTESDGGALGVALGEGLFAIAQGTLAFDALTNGAAVVASGQSFGLLGVSCPTATVATGALALDGNALVVTLLGEGCGTPAGGFIQCPLPAEPAGTLEGARVCDHGDAGPEAFPSGTYAECTDSIAGYGEGSVTLAENGGAWTATLSGVTGVATVSPALAISPSNSRAALVAPGQMVSVEESGWSDACDAGVGTNDPGVLPVPVSVTRTMTVGSGWLVVDGSSLLVFLGGTDECGAAVQESFNCVAQ